MLACKSFHARFIKQASSLKKEVLRRFSPVTIEWAAQLRGWKRKIKTGVLCRLLGGGQVQLGDGDARNASGGRIIHDDDFARREHIISDGLCVAVLEDQR